MILRVDNGYARLCAVKNGCEDLVAGLKQLIELHLTAELIICVKGFAGVLSGEDFDFEFLSSCHKDALLHNAGVIDFQNHRPFFGPRLQLNFRAQVDKAQCDAHCDEKGDHNEVAFVVVDEISHLSLVTIIFRRFEMSVLSDILPKISAFLPYAEVATGIAV